MTVFSTPCAEAEGSMGERGGWGGGSDEESGDHNVLQ